VTDDQQSLPLGPEGEEPTEEELIEQARLQIGGVFTPASPVRDQDLFAGRVQQFQDLVDVVSQVGQHGVIYGERGVGKTSIASVLQRALSRHGQIVAVRVNCDGTDTYGSMWRKAFEEVSFTRDVQPPGFNREAIQTMTNLAQTVTDIDPSVVRRMLAKLGAQVRTVFFFDEFDRVRADGVHQMMADTIKTLSDQLIAATVILVGVADTVDDLIAEHRSIERALVQVQMPRMSKNELGQIVQKGLQRVTMNCDRKALSQITQLSQGLPHYTHLLSLHAARVALEDERRSITPGDVDLAIERAMDRVQESILNDYHKATFTTRETLYPQVLLAAALARGDDRGYFAPPDLREPLSTIMGRRYEIPQFSQHLHSLTEHARGSVLQKTGGERRWRFRFVNPLLQPYVIMKGLAEGMIDQAVIGRFS
jgi:Cdc6-like AAA superfamily ATPase